MFFWYHRRGKDLWPVRSDYKPNELKSERYTKDDTSVYYKVVGDVVELPEELSRVPLFELCKRYPPPGL
jgi:hypothetical protein